MNDININELSLNELSLDEQLKRGTTRRVVVTTGAKLAYAVPLVAATVGLTARGALAVCGGATPIAFVFDDENLCCGCCPQTGGGSTDQFGEVFEECQRLLAEQPTPVLCPLAGEAGSDLNRVCVAPDAKLT